MKRHDLQLLRLYLPFALIATVLCCDRAWSEDPAPGVAKDSADAVDVEWNAANIATLAKKKDYKQLTKVLDDLDCRWKREASLQYFDAVWAINQAVLETEGLSRVGKQVVLDVLKRAMEKGASGEVKNYQLFIRQADFLPSLMREDVFGNEPAYRASRWSILASFMARINDVRDPDYVPATVYTKVPPIIVEGAKPGDIPLGGTMDPATIKDPEIRRKYEERIRENQKNLETNQEKSVANQIYARYETEIKRFLARLALDDPQEIADLEVVLRKGKFSKEFRADVLKRVKERKPARVKEGKTVDAK
ncbi:hypothetical protein OAS39_11135 [Pirellulales bacterium]|nr:hypothetical protein [Pirellulales bacterium]